MHMRLVAVLSVASLVLSVTGSTEAAPKDKPAPAGATFDKTAASAVLASVDLQKCRTTNAPRGEGHVMVTFAPAGTASQAKIDRGPMVGTPVQKCIEKAFKKAKVPAFSGTEVQVGKTFKFE